MEKITKEQFDIVKSNITKKNTVEKYVNLTKLVLDTAAMKGDDYLDSAVVFISIALKDISDRLFDNDDKIVCDDEKPKKD